MIQETSIQAFNELVASGRQNTWHENILIALAARPNSTANEIFEYMKNQLGFNMRYDSNTRARFTELRKMGLAQNTGKRPCAVTGKTCLLWSLM